ncbi:MAG: CapA family protein, partial [Candidatus Pacebacteria bacterium]|nr:CapA family protein [Candidatus Paceibacterota bacterium]
YGADIVIGHHPHVTQPIKKYDDKYIAYSLGNFVFDQYFSEETMSGFLLEVEIQENEVISAKKKYYKLNKHYQPEIYKEEVLN